MGNAAGVDAISKSVAPVNNVKTNKMKILKSDVITNIFYIFLGVVAYMSNLPFLIYISPIVLGIGSGVYHYFSTRLTAYFDWIPIYMVFNSLLAYTVMSGDFAIFLWGILTLLAATLDIATRGEIRKFILGVIGIGLLTGIVVTKGFDPFLYIAFLYSVAFVPWKLGGDINVMKVSTSRYALYHGFWHIITTYAIWENIKIIFDISTNVL